MFHHAPDEAHLSSAGRLTRAPFDRLRAGSPRAVAGRGLHGGGSERASVPPLSDVGERAKGVRAYGLQFQTGALPLTSGR
jgi:hypothetical protein